MTCLCSPDQAFHPALVNSHCPSCSPSSSRSSSPEYYPNYEYSPQSTNQKEIITVDFDTGYLNLDAMTMLNGGNMTLVEYRDEMTALHRQNEKTRDQNRNMRMLHREYNRFMDRDFIDLHFLPTVLAMDELRKRLEGMRAGIRPSVLYVCMGVGNNSLYGVPLIKGQIIQDAAQLGYVLREMCGNRGVLILSLLW